MQRIDSHIHWGDDSPEMLTVMEEHNLHALNNCVPFDIDGKWRRKQTEVFRGLHERHGDRFEWIAGLEVPRFDKGDFCTTALEKLETDFAGGAVAVKVWKNVGMDITKPDGSYLQVDDPLFEPIWAFLIETGKPLHIHSGEPLACWLPLEEKTPHTDYYRQNPQWHMYGKPDRPHHREIMAARNRVLKAHPKLNVVCAHLASLEYDLDKVAELLDDYPNAAVDISGRFLDLAQQSRGKVRRFFDRYQDRVLFGTDRTFFGTKEGRAAEVRQGYATQFAYFESDATVEVAGTTYRGIDLPESIQRKFYWDNARTWFPGIF